MLPDKMQLEVIPSTAKQYSVVKKLLHDSRVSSLVIATDAGREGELVARWILDKAGFRGPTNVFGFLPRRTKRLSRALPRCGTGATI